MRPPKITTQRKPHWHQVIEFPNGNQVMVCDASGNDDLGEHDVVVTVIHRSDTPVMYRTHQESERMGITYSVPDLDIVG